MMPLQKRDKSVHLKGLSASFLEMLFATKKKKMCFVSTNLQSCFIQTITVSYKTSRLSDFHCLFSTITFSSAFTLL